MNPNVDYRRFVFDRRSHTEEGLAELSTWIEQAQRWRVLPRHLRAGPISKWLTI